MQTLSLFIGMEFIIYLISSPVSLDIEVELSFTIKVRKSVTEQLLWNVNL